MSVSAFRSSLDLVKLLLQVGLGRDQTVLQDPPGPLEGLPHGRDVRDANILRDFLCFALPVQLGLFRAPRLSGQPSHHDLAGPDPAHQVTWVEAEVDVQDALKVGLVLGEHGEELHRDNADVVQLSLVVLLDPFLIHEEDDVRTSLAQRESLLADGDDDRHELEVDGGDGVPRKDGVQSAKVLGGPESESCGQRNLKPETSLRANEGPTRVGVLGQSLGTPLTEEGGATLGNGRSQP